MKLKDIFYDKYTIILFTIMCIITVIIILLLTRSGTNNSKINPRINIDEKIATIKNNHSNIEYVSTNIPGYISFVFNDNGYENIILDTTTGEEITFPSLIKEKEEENFNQKEIELLSLKYPEFIVDSIKTGNGTKTYYVKDNEVIIYYYDYTYPFDYHENPSLRIDYNEIKNMLKFKAVLNDFYENETGYQVDTNKKAVALTFDDGPSGTYNNKILNALEKNKAHATFFMVGNMMEGCPSCVLNTYKSGNEIGTHTYEHMNMKTTPSDKVDISINKTDEIYYNITKDNIKLIRPPYGSYSKTNMEKINKPFILWNLDTEDWRYRDVNHIVNYIKENVSDGAIILMHELYDASYESLNIILPWLYTNGYQVVSITELAKIKGKTLEAGSSYYNIN